MTNAASVLLVATLCIACGPSEPLTVSAIQTGKSLNSDNSIRAHAAAFQPNDTMYVSVLTPRRGAGTLTVRWSFAGRVIHEQSKKVAYQDEAATDFRFQAGDAFPAGEYTIEVLLDGNPVGTRRVKVEY